MAARKAHPGFKGAARQMMQRKNPPRDPYAVLGADAQKASPAAKRRNPRLTKVGGVGRPGRRGAGQAG